MLSFIKKEKRDLREEMLDNLRLAHRQWKDKENYFESVTDPDLIDYAIYDMEASKLKYIYLLKQMKEWDMSSKLQEESKDEDISISG
ncbi:DUF2508 family protein [Tissierella praeacuta]|uniref:DUF2508 domain-containing protein n=1 Tax=Tissierella praeacuta DSM 18095 TaxID=1123404 RepID=A0A1M4VHS2_9FIRM|nr:DUF2508 family protein [Tissierella praeacuta]TCU79238.1 uncharacterized protein DUF2508 [Tissierella praeacuta]SHE68447.1 Protein of unknown function [Tissierella praeacuta DSM 18095]SUO99136.1 Uncharacterised protein [Tissierella praeacuta]HAE92284.1 DUF2508 domain-containing protein [Tissierella sp.]